MSPLARLGFAALAGAVLVGAPLHEARAADHRGGAEGDAPITALGEQLAATQRNAGARLKGLVQQALDRAAQRMQEVRFGMERVVTFGHGLDGLAALDDSALEEPAEDEGAEADEPTPAPKRPRRLEYVEETNDPLAGL